MRYRADFDIANPRAWRELLAEGSSRFAAAVRGQWVFAALLSITWCGEALLVIRAGEQGVARLVVSTVLVLLALAAPGRPAVCGLFGAGFLVVATALTRFVGIEPGPGVLPHVSFAENFAGLLLVLYSFRELPRTRAVPVTASLVAGCLLAVFARSPVGEVYGLPLTRTLEVGFLQLVLAVGTGMYLGGSRRGPTTQHPTAVLLRKHWPIIAALSVLLFFQLLYSDFGAMPFDGIVLFTSSVIMVVLAVFAPRRPLQAALLGAVTLLLTVGLTVLFGIEGHIYLLGSVPPPVVASGMLLIAFAVRLRPLREAAVATATLAAAAVTGVLLMPRELHGSSSPAMFGPLFMGGVLLVLSVSAGMYFRARDEERARGVSAAVAEAQHAERMALARELHDVVAHHVTGIVVQAQAGLTVAERRPEVAREALERISSSGTEALTAMRRLVGSMRDAESLTSEEIGGHPTTDLRADLRKLLESDGATGAGTELRLDVELEAEVPQEVARSALRLVQESVTNSDKHAFDASVIDVTVHTVARELLVRVRDNGSPGSGSPAGGSGGYGLVGMRERIELLGGVLTAGPAPRGGWQVEARLPLTESQAGRGGRDPGLDSR